jgi:hypothetical protein
LHDAVHMGYQLLVCFLPTRGCARHAECPMSCWVCPATRFRPIGCEVAQHGTPKVRRSLRQNRLLRLAHRAGDPRQLLSAGRGNASERDTSAKPANSAGSEAADTVARYVEISSGWEWEVAVVAPVMKRGAVHYQIAEGLLSGLEQQTSTEESFIRCCQRLRNIAGRRCSDITWSRD